MKIVFLVLSIILIAVPVVKAVNGVDVSQLFSTSTY